MIFKTGFGHRWLAMGVLLTVALCLAGCTSSVSDIGIAQERLDTPSPPLDGAHTLVQSFTAGHDNLHEIELLPAIYGPPAQGALHLRLRRTGSGANDTAEQRIDASSIRDGVPIRFAFGPLADSGGQQYELHITGEPGVQVGLWYNSVDAYGKGQLTVDDQERAGDLRFVTRHRYDWHLASQDAMAAVVVNYRLVLPLLLLLLVPGYALCRGLIDDQDPVSVAALCLVGSLAAVPVALLWSTVLNVRWNRSWCVLAFSALAVGAVVQGLRRRLRYGGTVKPRANLSVALAVSGILAATLVLRLLQIRNLVLPTWVDSLQHALVTNLITISGQVPHSYEPLLPIERFIYHFGFHAVNAAFHWLSGLAIPQAMLLLGQVLNASSALMGYALTVRLSGRRAAGVVAALVTGLVSYMPAYYVSWGRYTQLKGLLLLSGSIITTLDWLEAERGGARRLVLATLLQAGLILTHVRVAVFGACFVAAFLLFETRDWARGAQYGKLRRLWQRTATLGAAALLLSGPWLRQVLSGFQAALRAGGDGLQAVPSYNAFPWAFALVPRNRELIALAVLGALLGLAQRRKETLWLLGGCGLVALLVNPGWLGLPSLGFLNNATAVIALYVPLAVLAGQAFVVLWDRVPAWCCCLTSRAIDTGVRIVLALLVAAVGLWGAWGMVSIVNPATVLATAEDLVAMSWIAENTPADAVFAINARHWQLGTYAGTDGGYWIPQLTGRKTLLPDLSYSYGSPDYVQHIRDMAQVVSEMEDTSDPGFLRLLEEERVTHIYLGAKGGPLTPQMFLADPRFRTVYSTGEVWIFAVL